jgi:hypothetical protein
VTYLKVKDGKQSFQVFFLKNDRYQSVIVNEAEELDLPEIKKHLSRGESIFITSREKLEVRDHIAR